MSDKRIWRGSVRYLEDHRRYVMSERASTGYGKGVDGYGKKIATRWMVKLAGEKRLRRVYAICYSNVASHYVEIMGERFYLRSV